MSLFGGHLRPVGPKLKAEGRDRGGVFKKGVNCVMSRPQIHFGPTKSLENASSGRKSQMQFNFFTEHRRSHGTLGYH